MTPKTTLLTLLALTTTTPISTVLASPSPNPNPNPSHKSRDLVSDGVQYETDFFTCYCDQGCTRSNWLGWGIGGLDSGTCVELPSGVAATNVDRGNLYTDLWCQMYTGSACDGTEQNIGVAGLEDMSCTDSQVGWWYSVRCYF
ncbi:hypothetical protein BO71DRAFT_426239 [Aspergillus ellipticus CBS 707.79]|uniref:Uncharacterized protein n=1 Tax=Aspergillus ellipticus CBS 707.79 TaxID=1448320 RepID=A0A319DLM4_9EURO|nr:hypothetical protein BO71DRAFT_426239 [Aspergillus ellipticus CBS 707.79]